MAIGEDHSCSLTVVGGDFGPDAMSGPRPLLDITPRSDLHPVQAIRDLADEAGRILGDDLKALLHGTVELPDRALLAEAERALVSRQLHEIAVRQFRTPAADGAAGVASQLVGITSRFANVDPSCSTTASRWSSIPWTAILCSGVSVSNRRPRPSASRSPPTSSCPPTEPTAGAAVRGGQAETIAAARRSTVAYPCLRAMASAALARRSASAASPSPFRARNSLASSRWSGPRRRGRRGPRGPPRAPARSRSASAKSPSTAQGPVVVVE